METFKSPVVVSGCGHLFCRSCLEQIADSQGDEKTCSTCRQPYDHYSEIKEVEGLTQNLNDALRAIVSVESAFKDRASEEQ